MTRPPEATTPELSAADADALADRLALRVAELLRRPEPAGELVDAQTLAGLLGVERSYVYAHAAELGAVRLGGGSKPRLRFDLEAAREAMARYAGKQSQAPTRALGACSGCPQGVRRKHHPRSP